MPGGFSQDPPGPAIPAGTPPRREVSSHGVPDDRRSSPSLERTSPKSPPGSWGSFVFPGRSGELQRTLRQAVPEPVDPRAAGLLLRGRAEGDEQRREVLDPRVRERRRRRLVPEVEQRVDVAAAHHLVTPVV